jgi:hypothetical protein
VSALLAGLTPIEAFPTVDEMAVFTARLASEHPDRVTVREIGRSRQGEAIQLLSITAPGARGSALVIGQPHPNEPIGMATIVALCERLLADPAALEATGCDWHVVPVADPDGTRLNEGWFAGPFTREHYARHFYRPESHQQVEWTFPFSTEGFVTGEPMPETRALMAAIDLVKPTALASLHNGEMGGGYYYATAGAPSSYYEGLGQLCTDHDIPLHLGDPETPFSEVLAPAVFTVPTAQQIHDFLVSVGGDPAELVSGSSSAEYAAQVNPDVFGVAIELPYWRDARSDDTAPDPSGRSLAEVVLHGLDLQDDMAARLRALLDAARPEPSPFHDAVVAFTAQDDYNAVQRQGVLADPGSTRPATVAEVFSVMDNVHMFRLRLGGMLLRALDPSSPVLAEAEALFAGWCSEAAADNQAETIPIADLVAVQGGAILATVQHVVTSSCA